MRVQPWVSPATRPTMAVPAHGLATPRPSRNLTGRLPPSRTPSDTPRTAALNEVEYPAASPGAVGVGR